MADTIPARLFQRAKDTPTLPAYHVKSGNLWRATNWQTYAEEVRTAGRALISLGVEPGSGVAILGFNRPEWVIVDVAAMCIGGAAAGVYTTCSPEEVQYIVDHCEATVLLVENEDQWKKVDAQRENLPKLKHVITMKGAPAIDDELVMSWDEFLARADETDSSVFDERLAALEPDQLATLIYTSGTTGPPKGVMLSHNNLVWTASTMLSLVEASSDDCGVSYLPLSHIAEQMMTIHGTIVTGSSVYYAESLDKLIDNLKEVQPTMIFGVPRIWEKMHAGLSERLDAATGIKKALIQFVRATAREVTEVKNRGETPGPVLKLRYAIANKLVLSKLKPMIGLGRARLCVTGAAPIAREVLEFFASLDLVICEVYGQSEGSGPTSFNRPGRVRYGTVGPAIPGCEVKIAEDGEILVKGPNVFLGYLKEPEATAETLDEDGWLHSGDLGEFDRDGFLSITGRKKDIIITAGGKNIAPKNIEAALKNTRLINEAVVIGDRRKYLTALVTLDEEATATFLNGSAGESPHKNQAVLDYIQTCVDDINKTLANVETIKKFTVLDRNFSIEDGELTPTLKVKRKIVNENFADEIEAMY